MHLQSGGLCKVRNPIERGALHGEEIALGAVAGLLQQCRTRGFALGDEGMVGMQGRAAAISPSAWAIHTSCSGTQLVKEA